MGLVSSCLAVARDGLGLQPLPTARHNSVYNQPGMVSNIDPARLMGDRPQILRHRCRVRILHSLAIVTSVAALIVDIAGRVMSEDDSISKMMPTIWIGIPACIAASMGICSMSRYTTPYRRKCLFNAQYVFYIFTTILIIGMGIYMATEFRSYMDRAEYAKPTTPAVVNSTAVTVTKASADAYVNQTLIVIRAVELSILMVLLVVCIVVACLMGRELCPECGCDCDCDCNDDDLQPVAPRQPVQVPAEQQIPADVNPLGHYEYFGRQPHYISMPAVPVVSQPFMPEEEPRTDYVQVAAAGMDQIRRTAGKFFRRSAKGPAPSAPPPPSYSEATRDMY